MKFIEPLPEEEPEVPETPEETPEAPEIIDTPVDVSEEPAVDIPEEPVPEEPVPDVPEPDDTPDDGPAPLDLDIDFEPTLF